MKKRAILLLTRNSCHILPFFVKSLQEYVNRGVYDIIVYDNGSNKVQLEILNTYVKDKTFDYFETTNGVNYLYTRGANWLLRKAIERNPEIEHLVLVNPDIEFLEDWDKDIESNEGIMGFVMKNEWGHIEHAGAVGLGDHIGKGIRDNKEIFTELRNVDWVTFACVDINRKVIDKIGFLEEKYCHFSSDRVFCKKAIKNGFNILCSPSRLIHGFGKSTRFYSYDDVPDDIWQEMVEERKSQGVHIVKNISKTW